MRFHTASSPLRTALVLALATLPLSAQRGQALIDQDIEFARGLAASWGFTDMSESVLARLEKEATSGRSAEEVALLKCDIYAIGAARITDPAQRQELLKKALIAYEQYIEGHPNAQNRARAEISYVDAAVNYGRALATATEDAAGAELEALRKELQESLTRAVAKVGDLTNALQSNAERGEAEDRQLFELLMNRGALLLLIARSQTDGVFNFEQAKRSYEQVVDLAGETSSAGLRAFIGFGDVSMAMGTPREAVDFYSFVGDTAVPRDAAAWKQVADDFGPEEVQRRFALLQLATPGILAALGAAGEAPRACEEGMRFLNVWNRDGLDLVPPYGYQSLLGIVQALSDAGGFVGGDLKSANLEWFPSAEGLQAKFSNKRQQRTAFDLALALAQQVNAENRGNTTGLRAQRVIADLIEQPGVDVSPEILIEAARGKLSDRDYPGAVEAYKRVMTALESVDPAERKLQGPRVLNAIGRAYMSMERPLEAAMVFQEAVAHWLGDPEFDSLNSRGFYNAANALKRKIKGDALIDGLYASATQAVEQNDQQGAGEILYMKAEKTYETDKDYAKAREEYKAVPDNTLSYEKALVKIGLCEYQLAKAGKGDYDAAIRIFDDYLNKYLKDPLHAIGASELAKEAKRNEAIATASFYWGLAEFYKAEGGGGDWRKVAQLLDGYEDKFPQQDRIAPAAMYRSIVAHFHLGEQDEVDRIYAKLLERFPTDRWTATAALDIYEKLEKRYKELAASKDPADAAKARDVLTKMARYLEVGNKNASTPTFANLRRESQHWVELGEWAKAEALLIKLRDKFGSGNDKDATQVQQYVLPDLGLALFRQQKMQEAADVLGPLVEAKKATFEATLNYARALSGMAEQVLDERGKARSMRVVAGVGGKDALAKAAELYGKLLETVKSKEGAWTPAWLDLKFEQIYCLHLYSKVDSKIAESAQAQIKLLQSEYGGDELPALPDANLRAKFTWLMAQMR